MFGLNLGMNIKARYDVTDGSGNYLPDGNGGELQDVNLNDKIPLTSINSLTWL